MRGSPRNQAKNLYLRSGISQIGHSKHAAKAEARANGARSWHDIGKSTGIHSYRTKDAYIQVWSQVLDFGKHLPPGERILDMEQVNQRIVTGFLEQKIAEGVSHATFAQYAAAIEKMETALNLYSDRHHSDDGRHQTYSFDLSLVREQAKDLDRPGRDFSRAYERPDELRSALRSETYRIAAAVQHEGGARLQEINGLPAQNLLGNDTIRLTNTKGGRVRDIHISHDTYRALEHHMQEHDGKFSFSSDGYRNALKEASEASGQAYEGSHGLRWNFAQEAMQTLQTAEKMTYDESLAAVADELGHNREDITRHYLR